MGETVGSSGKAHVQTIRRGDRKRHFVYWQLTLTHPPRAELSTGGLREHLLGLAFRVQGFDIGESLGF